MKFQERLLDFFACTPDLMCLATLDGYFTQINPAFEKTLGYSEQELLSQRFIDFIHPSDVECTLSELDKLAHGQKSLDFKNRYRHANGHYITLAWTSYCDRENNLIYATARDITELQKSREKLNQIQSAMNEKTILAITDSRGVIKEINDNFLKISGYSREELIGKTHKVVNSGKHHQRFFATMWKTISSGKVWSGVIQNRKKNGKYYYVSTIITPIFDDLGKITEYLSFRYDVTDSVINESRALNTFKVLNETSAIAKVGGWELDIETGELTWTDETFRILEVEKKQNQKPILPEGIALFIPEHQPIIEQAVQSAIEYGTPYSLELMALTAKGNQKWVYTNGRANCIDGKPVTLSGTIQDIDERKRAQIDLEREKAKSIHTARLASLGELSASVAHEINNPLTIISTYAELLANNRHSQDKSAEFIDRILKSTDRISNIISSLKKFSRSDETSRKRRFNVQSMLEEVITLVTPKLKKHNIVIQIECSPTTSIFGSENEIEQVFINLINNGVDAINKLNDKWIKIEVFEDTQNVQIWVTDSGTGISSDARDKIFEPFFTSKDSDKGTGLGLSIVLGILEEHRATIDVDPTSEHTRFKLTFNNMDGTLDES